MKLIVIGLGNFGAALAIRMTELGHEVIGVDSNSHKVEELKDQITSTICMNAEEFHDLKYLPLDDTDAVVVSIGETFGTSVLVTAQLKQLGVKRIMARSISALHKTVLEAIGVSEIFSPELDMAESFALKLELENVVSVFHISKDFKVVEAITPAAMVNRTIGEIGFEENYNLQLLSIKRMEAVRNMIGISSQEQKVYSQMTNDFTIVQNDVLIIAGTTTALKKLWAVL
ncbi:MAG TPA: TrkA family potassium uptake protein [Williamwhitmania sp.]|nr:TrkA family potassium uptake protein [Williamwhitmania sp.]